MCDEESCGSACHLTRRNRSCMITVGLMLAVVGYLFSRRLYAADSTPADLVVWLSVAALICVSLLGLLGRLAA
jgi:hypothetical protein